MVFPVQYTHLDQADNRGELVWVLDFSKGITSLLLYQKPKSAVSTGKIIINPLFPKNDPQSSLQSRSYLLKLNIYNKPTNNITEPYKADIAGDISQRTSDGVASVVSLLLPTLLNGQSHGQVEVIKHFPVVQQNQLKWKVESEFQQSVEKYFDIPPAKEFRRRCLGSDMSGWHLCVVPKYQIHCSAWGIHVSYWTT